MVSPQLLTVSHGDDEGAGRKLWSRPRADLNNCRDAARPVVSFMLGKEGSQLVEPTRCQARTNEKKAFTSKKAINPVGSCGMNQI